ncbi:MAG: hypothetical protein NVS4B8_17230 [Herpetosiphon sp.]
MQFGTTRQRRHNFLVNVLDGTAWLFGISFVSSSTILPVFLRHLSPSPVVIGLIAVLIDAGWFLPQLFLAPFVQRQRRQKPLVLWLGLVERIPFLLLPLIFGLLPRLFERPDAALWIFLGLIGLRGLMSGFVAVPWQEFIARLIPPRQRGRSFSAQQMAGNFAGLGGAAIAAWLLARLPYPRNFIACFAIAAAGVFVSWVFIALSQEPEHPVEPSTGGLDRAYLDHIITILRQDHNFRTFLLSRSCSYLSTMSLGFLAVAATTRFDLSDAQAAIFTTLLLIGSIIGSSLWGMVADRIGYKAVMYGWASTWGAALIIAIIASKVWNYYPVFVLVGIAEAAAIVINLAGTMAFGPPAERPTYLGIARTMTAPLLIVTPLVGGIIAGRISYPGLFAVSLPFILLAVFLTYRLQEPEIDEELQSDKHPPVLDAASL